MDRIELRFCWKFELQYLTVQKFIAKQSSITVYIFS